MIKAQFENINPGSDTSFLVNTFVLDRFTVPYHFHPEYELTLILKGKGKRYVGKNMEDFNSGDLILLGPELPHSWKSEDVSEDTTGVKSIVIQFEKNCFGAEFFNKPELSNISNLLKLSAYGIKFMSATAELLQGKMDKLSFEQNALKKMLMLLDLLETLSESKDYRLLDQDGVVARQSASNKERINAALGYIVDNFQNEIVLDRVAAAVNMSPNAFCKYFKKVTGKTFMDTVIDYRINFAVQQLLATEKTVSDISLESGFGDVSHFYKLFKRRMQISPLNYRKSFLAGL